MWKKLYSNSGLILIAVLAAGVWFSNVRSIYQAKTTPPQPQTLTAEDRLQIWRQELRALGRTVKAKYPGAYDDLTDEDVGRRVKAKYPGAYDDFTDTAAAQLSPTPTPRKSAEEILGITPSPTPGKYADFEQVINAPRGASALCKDGTYSFSQSRRGTCSHHGGVAQWLSR